MKAFLQNMLKRGKPTLAAWRHAIINAPRRLREFVLLKCIPRRTGDSLVGTVFDEAWYLSEYPDARDSGLSAIVHYDRIGRHDGRVTRHFDCRWYLDHHKDLAATNIDAWSHFECYGRAEGRAARYAMLRYVVEHPKEGTYREWLDLYDPVDPTDTEIWLKAVRQTPKIVLILTGAEAAGSFIEETYESVLAQSYWNWELLVTESAAEMAPDDRRIKVVGEEDLLGLLAQANGQWVGVMRAGDRLHPNALLLMTLAIEAQPEAKIVYSDEDKISAQGERCDPYFKCAVNPELLLTHDMFGGLTLYARDRLRGLSALSEGLAPNGQIYDLALRIYVDTPLSAILHVPHILYHASLADDDPIQRTAQSVQVVRNHLQRLNVPAEVSPAPEAPGYVRVRYALPDASPKVSIIIPTRDRADLLEMCLDSLLSLTDYPDYEVIIVDNGSVEPATFSLFERFAQKGVRILRDDSPFNYSALNNRAVEVAEGEFVCLLNNDIEITHPDWLSEMVSFAIQPDAGCIGARLWYPNDLLQHAGVLVGFHGVAGHMHKFLRRGDPGYAHRAVLQQNLSAVTAACLLVRKSIYTQVGGLDEELAVAFNDVDFCLRVRDAGYRNVWTPYAEMYHHESASRGEDTTPEKRARGEREIQRMKAVWGARLMEDPAYSPNLSLVREDLSLAWPPRTPRNAGSGCLKPSAA